MRLEEGQNNVPNCKNETEEGRVHEPYMCDLMVLRQYQCSLYGLHLSAHIPFGLRRGRRSGIRSLPTNI